MQSRASQCMYVPATLWNNPRRDPMITIACVSSRLCRQGRIRQARDRGSPPIHNLKPTARIIADHSLSTVARPEISPRFSGKLIATEVNRDHEQVANRPQVRPAHKGATARGHLDPLDVHHTVDVLGRRE